MVINVILCLLLMVPGVIHALRISLQYSSEIIVAK
ncbi:MAG: YqaE/Pmp3 family membrane protein [Pseudomonadales bacterium]|nr:YqaE/Pmp3 family membrane protein [Pseudomonadales bacterium]